VLVPEKYVVTFKPGKDLECQVAAAARAAPVKTTGKDTPLKLSPQFRVLKKLE
jgi:hypothetical protein